MFSTRHAPTRAARRTLPAIAIAMMLSAAALAPAAAADGDVSQLAGDPCNGGSSNPTFYTNNHRVVTTGGRTLAVWDPHGSDVKIAWRDGTGAWSSKTIFDNAPDEVANDRPASIALDANGHAWVAWSGYSFAAGKEAPVKLRRLDDLGAASGPTVGPITTVQAKDRGNTGVDLQILNGRGYLVWLTRSGDSLYELVTAQFNPSDTTPVIADRSVIYSASGSSASATLVPTSAGMRIAARAGSLKIYVHNGGASWSAGSAAVSFPSKSKPSAVEFGGEIYVAFQSAPFNDEIVKVSRFNLSGSSVSTSLTTSGSRYVQPVLAAGGGKLFVVMVQKGTVRTVVSRSFNGTSWGGDVTEISAQVTNGGDFAYPNTETQISGGRLRFIVDGKRCPSSNQRNAVLGYDRAA
ncbi:MAG: hypothetical protein ABR529_04995 [Actinomycetota bacterium]